MIANYTVTNAAAVTVYTPAAGTNNVLVQNNGAVAARLSIGGTTSGSADTPTTTTGLRLLAGASITFSGDEFRRVSTIKAISEGADTTIAAVTD